jgi:hypothetical protein
MFDCSTINVFSFLKLESKRILFLKLFLLRLLEDLMFIADLFTLLKFFPLLTTIPNLLTEVRSRPHLLVLSNPVF